MEIPHLIPLVRRKGDGRLRDKCLHLHVLRPHKRPGDPAKIDPLVTLIDVVCLDVHIPTGIDPRQSRLRHQRRL